MAREDGFEPLQLFEERQPPRFPIEALPQIPRDYVMTVASDTQVAPDMVAMVVLPALSAGIAAKYVVEPAPGWQEPTTLYCIGLIDSGEGKSTVLKRISKIINAYERDLSAKLIRPIAQRRAELDVVRRKANDARERNDEVALAEAYAAEQAHRPIAPPRVVMRDSTPEALQSLLHQHPNLLVLAAEGDFVSTCLGGRYSEGDPRVEAVLSAYDAEQLIIDRKGSSLTIERPVLTIALLTQPVVWTELAKQRKTEERGLTARMLVAKIPLPDKPRELVHNQDRTEVEASSLAFEKLLSKLYAYGEPRESPYEVKKLTFHEAARTRFTEHYNQHQRVLRDGEFEGFQAWAGKKMGFVARIAAILHVTKWASVANDIVPPEQFPVSQESVDEAVKIVEYFEAQRRQLAEIHQDEASVEGAKRIANWLNRVKTVPKRLKRRDIQRGVSALKGTLLDDAIEELCERGFLKRCDSTSDYLIRSGLRLDRPTSLTQPSNAGETHA